MTSETMLPSDERWDESRRAFNLAVDQLWYRIERGAEVLRAWRERSRCLRRA